MQVAAGNYVVTVIMQSLDRTWPWSKKLLKDMPDYDLRLVDTERGVLLALPAGFIERVQRVGIHQIVSGTRCSFVRASAAILCSVLLCWSCTDLLDW